MFLDRLHVAIVHQPRCDLPHFQLWVWVLLCIAVLSSAIVFAVQIVSTMQVGRVLQFRWRKAVCAVFLVLNGVMNRKRTGVDPANLVTKSWSSHCMWRILPCFLGVCQKVAKTKMLCPRCNCLAARCGVANVTLRVQSQPRLHGLKGRAAVNVAFCMVSMVFAMVIRPPLYLPDGK